MPGTASPADLQPQSTAPGPPLIPASVTVAGHGLTVFAEALPLMTAMLLDIRAATLRVWLETYIFFDDAAGRAIAEALKSRARAGVEVRVLYDAIGSQATTAAFFDELRQAGAHVHAFHSLGEALWRSSFLRILNRRDHRKLLIIDDRVAYFGGMNIIDAASTFHSFGPEHPPFSAGWRDIHVRLVGPQQRELAESFDRSWRRSHGEPVPRRPQAYRQAKLPEEPEFLRFFDSGPGRAHTRAGRLFTRLILAARRQVTLSMAYFLPVGAVLSALLKAPRRGVHVVVVVPGQGDVPIVQRATRHLYDQLLSRRLRVYERQVNMLHSKMLVADDEWCLVGSCNLDARSLWINLEFLAVIRSRALAQVLNEIVAFELARSRRVTLRELRTTGWWNRLLNRLAWALRWWL